MGDARDRLIVALDETEPAAARALIERLDGQARWLKVGLALYGAGGPGFVLELLDQGYEVFLDLKLHDIPHQVGAAVEVHAKLGAKLLTIHTSGGAAMMRAAAESAAGSELAVIGVTVLTSLDSRDLAEIGARSDARSLVLDRARLAVESGLAGVVASAVEAAAVADALGAGVEIVTPGIRPAGTSADDQRRVATPAEAIRGGATRLVVGRPITRAGDPAAATVAILDEMRAAT